MLQKAVWYLLFSHRLSSWYLTFCGRKLLRQISLQIVKIKVEKFCAWHYLHMRWYSWTPCDISTWASSFLFCIKMVCHMAVCKKFCHYFNVIILFLQTCRANESQKLMESLYEYIFKIHQTKYVYKFLCSIQWLILSLWTCSLAYNNRFFDINIYACVSHD